MPDKNKNFACFIEELKLQEAPRAELFKAKRATKLEAKALEDLHEACQQGEAHTTLIIEQFGGKEECKAEIMHLFNVKILVLDYINKELEGRRLKGDYA